jgi:hypothetical protein
VTGLSSGKHFCPAAHEKYNPRPHLFVNSRQIDARNLEKAGLPLTRR